MSIDGKTAFWNSLKWKDVALVLFFTFTIQFAFVPLNTSRLVLLYCLAMLAIAGSKKKLYFLIRREAFFSLFGLFLFALYTAMSSLVYGSDNIANLLNIFIILGQIVLTAYLLSVFFIDGNIDYLLFVFLVIFGLQGLLIFLNFLIPPYREFMYSVIPVGGNITEDNFTSAFRTRGLMQSSGATVASYISIGFLFIAYFISSFQLSKTDRRIVLLCAPLILLGVLFTGRTGFLMIPVALLLYYGLLLINGRFSFRSLRLLLYLPAIVVVAYFILRSLFLTIFPDDSIVLSQWESWAFESFARNFSSDSSEGKKSALDHLQTLFFIPEDDETLVWGNPQTWGVIRTDLGYIRMLFSVGIIGSALFYGGMTLVYYYLIKRSSKLTTKVLMGVIFLWIAFIEYKEPMFSHFYFASTTMLMLFFTMKGKQQL